MKEITYQTAVITGEDGRLYKQIRHEYWASHDYKMPFVVIYEYIFVI